MRETQSETLLRLHWNYARAWEREHKETDYLEGERIANEIIALSVVPVSVGLSEEHQQQLREQLSRAITRTMYVTTNHRDKLTTMTGEDFYSTYLQETEDKYFASVVALFEGKGE